MQKIDYLFWKIGISGYYEGCYPLKVAVKLVWDGECDLRLVTGRLYPMVAAQVGVSMIKIERNMRTVITVFWDNGGRERLEKILGHKIRAKPTTKEFIDLLVSCLQHYERFV